MGLKQSVVVVNEFTVPLPEGKGSRGGTPGQYITRYMARELATEPVAPIKLFDADAYIARYMAREEAVERVDVKSVDDLNSLMERSVGAAGVAFGYGKTSLSDDQLTAASQDVQRLFDEGKTVMKTVISFDEAYLKKHGLVDEDFTLSQRGDYRGHLDQMKLRMAVMNGVERMGRSHYDDLRYVGVIQVDTEHVHCHLAMVDAGRGQIMPDGTQRGKLSQRSMSLLRRGIDSFLDEKKYVKHLSSAVQYERTNVSTYVRRWSHDQMLHDSLPQVLVAALPQDRRLWRASTNNVEMRQANAFVRSLVESILAEPDSPMTMAMAEVYNYADYRRDNEDLSSQQWSRLVDNGRERIVEKAMNAVYATLQQLPEDALRIRTPMLDAMGMDYEELARRATALDPEDDLVGLTYRLRSYSSRIDEHESAVEHCAEQLQYWHQQNDAGLATVDSQALYDFYEEEEEYHRRCLAKYRHLLPALSADDAWLERWREIQSYGDALVSLESMTKDRSLKATGDVDRAEQIGFEVYGQRGGHLVALGDPASQRKLAQRVTTMRENYEQKVADLREDLLDQGFMLNIERDELTGAENPVVVPGDRYPFDTVKGLDLHRMSYDFGSDVPVGDAARENFRYWANRRATALSRAREYLEGTDQPQILRTLPEREVAAMVSLSQRIDEDPVHRLPSEIAKLARNHQMMHRSATVPLVGEDLDERLRERVSLAASEPLVFVADDSSGLNLGRERARTE